MKSALLSDLRMTIESHSYIDAMHAVLTHKGWITCSKGMLAGMTAAAFRFTVNRRLSEESTTAYNWIAGNFLAADFIGITAGSNAGYRFDYTFPLYQKHALIEIKKSIDRGIGAIIWKDRFVIAAGYDDDRQGLLLSVGGAGEHELLLYSEFGCHVSPYWYFQVLEDYIEMDRMEIYQESLMQAIEKWETHDLMLPEQDYACGRTAYDAMVSALQSGDYDRDGLLEIGRCYAAAKRDIKLYTAELAAFWPQLKPAAEQYAKLALIFEEAALLAANIKSGADEEAVSRLIDLLQAGKHAEEAAIQAIKLFRRETIAIRTNDIALR